MEGEMENGRKRGERHHYMKPEMKAITVSVLILVQINFCDQ